MKHQITAEYLREILDYSPETGVFRWKKCPNNKRPKGSVAGTINPSGYRHIFIHGRSYKAHRLAWLYVHGMWPSHRIDHKDGNNSNNKFSNLRKATHSQNIANSKRRRDNKSGFKGVSREPTTGKWMAYINKDKRRHYLGLHDTPELAHAAYVEAASRLHKQFARFA